MEALAITKNQGLGIHLNPGYLKQAVQEVSTLNEIQFLKKVDNYWHIDEISDDSLQEGLRIIFSRITVFSGVKEGIDEIIQQDIFNSLVTRFHHLSLEEIEYAFALNRDGEYGEFIQHFQFVNREYVARVLRAYEKWKLTKKKLRVIANQEMSNEEIWEKWRVDLIRSFNRYLNTGKIENASNINSLYVGLFHKRLLPAHTIRFKRKTNRKVLRNEYRRAFKYMSYYREERLNELRKSESVSKMKCKAQILRTFFEKLKRTDTPITSVI